MTDIRDLGRAVLTAAGLLLTAAAPVWAGTTERVSVSSAGSQGDGYSYDQAISADGRFVAFHSRADNLVPGDTNGADDIFVRDRRTGRTERVSVSAAGRQGDGGSFSPSISADGRFVAFASRANNLVPGDTNGVTDVFVRDWLRGTTERVSIATGAQGDGDSGLGDVFAGLAI